jgi:hypothetical protein
MHSRVPSYLGFCVVFAVTSVHGQSVTVPSSSIPGVTLMGPNDLNFINSVTQVLGPSRTASVNDWLPFSVVLTDSSSQSIRATVVRWAFFRPDNNNNLSDTYVLSRTFLSSAGQLQPGKTVIVLPGWVLQGPVSSGQDPTDEPDHLARVQSFQAATRIEITLDGVLFASGQFVGPNLSHQFESMSARQAALVIFSSVLSQASAGQPTADIVAWLRTVAAESITMQTQGSSQDNAVRILSVRFARQLLQAYDNQGETQMFALAKARAQNQLNIFR